VLVDGAPRVACVTPVRRVAGRSVVTVDGLEPGARASLAAAFDRHAASQCGFCTPGILCRLASLGPAPTASEVENALLAHLCRCTGWRTLVDAACDQGGQQAAESRLRRADAAASRAAMEGGTAQRTGPEITLGQGGFADDTAPPGSLVAVPDGRGGWAVGETLAEARAAAGKVQGRRSGRLLSYPVDLPPGDWDLKLQTTWVEPAYLESDASWCLPGGQPANPVANGGAFGGKVQSIAPAAARELADRYRRPVRVVFSREDVVRLGPKRPPIAAGLRADGTGVIRVAAAPGVASAITVAAPLLQIEEVPVAGPLVSGAIRSAGWAEATVLAAAVEQLREGRAGLTGPAEASVVAPGGGRARAQVVVDESGWPAGVSVTVMAGDPLDEPVLRSYVTGACHMALGWVCSEAIAVDGEGVPEDLTIRSFGIIRARDMPPITVTAEPVDPGTPPVACSDAVFAAVAAATWLAQGLPPRWPTSRAKVREGGSRG
jgi:xanthine dehydrogenase small subunit